MVVNISHQAFDMHMTVEQKKQIWKKRARALARETASEERKRELLDVLAFDLAHETYAFELPHVREVLPLRDVTPLPGVPPFILGLILLRGEVLSVMDLKRFFELPAKGLTDLNRVIVLASRTMSFGVLADAILGVRSLPRDRIQPSLPTFTGLRAAYLKGVSEGGVVILDAEKILGDERNLVQ